MNVPLLILALAGVHGEVDHRGISKEFDMSNAAFLPVGDDGKPLSKPFAAWVADLVGAANMMKNTSVSTARMLDDYDRLVPPLGGANGDNDDVYMYFDRALALLDVDEKAQQIFLKLQIVIAWVDRRLLTPKRVIVEPSQVIKNIIAPASVQHR